MAELCNKDSYDTLGYTKYPSLFDSDFIDTVNEHIDNIVRDIKPSDTVFFEDGLKPKQVQYLTNYHQIFSDIVERFRPIAQELTGQSDLHVLNVQLFEKHPEISKPTRSHQDNAYFKKIPALPVTFWLSLDHIDETNGALYYAPYTHLLPTRKHSRYHPNTTFRVRSGVPGLSLCLHEHGEETDIIMTCKPGDVLVHNCNTIHRAGKNNSKDRRRRAIGVVFIPTICQDDTRLMSYFQEQLAEDIELLATRESVEYK